MKSDCQRAFQIIEKAYQVIFQPLMPDLEIVSSPSRNRVAVFSTNRLYRYILHITWDMSKPYCCFTMLNPSTADETKNDPTVGRCERRARSWGYGGVVILNVFAYRSTDPGVLYTVDDPVGPMNDKAINIIAPNAAVMVLGYGKHGKLLNRGAQVLSLLRELGVHPMALRLNKDGSPGHPLYCPYSLQPILV